MKKMVFLLILKNYNKLADAIIDLINNPLKRKELSIAAIRSSQKFSIEETVKQNIDEYNRLIER